MKTAVSIPDPIFRAAEKLAKRRKWSRSKLYAYALAQLVEAAGGDDVTRKLNEVYGGGDEGIDAGWARLQAEAIGSDEGW